MHAFIRRFLMHYGIYRRYPLGRFSALRNAWRAAHIFIDGQTFKSHSLLPSCRRRELKRSLSHRRLWTEPRPVMKLRMRLSVTDSESNPATAVCRARGAL